MITSLRNGHTHMGRGRDFQVRELASQFLQFLT